MGSAGDTAESEIPMAAHDPSPHLLLTCDAVGGVWTHTRELASGLRDRGWRVTVAVFGPWAEGQGTEWAEARGVPVVHGGGGLEWMEGTEKEVAAGQQRLRELVQDLRPDVLHANQFAAAAARSLTPCLLAVHSDVVSWWRAVHGCAPPRTPFTEFYEGMARAGLEAADLVVTPTAAARDGLRASFPPEGGSGEELEIIPNGMDGAGGDTKKRGYAAAAGRLWDAGKQLRILWQSGWALPVFIAGPREATRDGAAPRADWGRAPAGVQWVGNLAPPEMQRLLAGADVFIVPSCYEPFGLGALEAARNGCALLLNDIPSLREVWGDAAAYFACDDAVALGKELRHLAAHPSRRRRLAQAAEHRARERYGRGLMVQRYIAAYARVMGNGRAGARA